MDVLRAHVQFVSNMLLYFLFQNCGCLEDNFTQPLVWEEVSLLSSGMGGDARACLQRQRAPLSSSHRARPIAFRRRLPSAAAHRCCRLSSTKFGGELDRQNCLRQSADLQSRYISNNSNVTCRFDIEGRSRTPFRPGCSAEKMDSDCMR